MAKRLEGSRACSAEVHPRFLRVKPKAALSSPFLKFSEMAAAYFPTVLAMLSDVMARLLLLLLAPVIAPPVPSYPPKILFVTDVLQTRDNLLTTPLGPFP